MKLVTILVIPTAVVFLVIDGVIFFALAGSVWRWIDRPRVALAAAVLGSLILLSGIPFVREDLSHIESWGSFAPAVVALVVGLAAIVAGFISFFAPRMQGSRLLAGTAAALSVVLVVLSVSASLSVSSDAAQPNDVQLLAQDVKFPETLDASAGLIGFHVTNRDPIRHTFVIEGTDVKLELPASTERRVEVDLAAGEYNFICDVPGHDRMKGVLTVS